MKKDVSVVLVDDHAMIRKGCRLSFEAQGFNVLAEADSGESSVAVCLREKPDVVVVDIAMPGVSGLETIRRLCAHVPDVRIVVFTMHDDCTIASRALRAGARAYVTKTSPPETLVEAVRRVANGDSYLSEDIALNLALREAVPGPDPLAALTKREFEVFHMLVKGRRPGQIAETLSLSAKAVSNYQQKIKVKLNANSLADLVHIALESGLEKLRS
jgi:two-component system, NarL family, invasion response regulator UvrY